MPLNPMPDGTCRTIKRQYQQTSLANFLRRGGTQRQVSSNGVKMIGRVYKSQQNGGVFDPDGIAPCICVGHHSGVEPKIIVYE